MRELIKNVVLFIAVFTLVFFTIFELRKVIVGPVISISYPYDGYSTSTSTITLKGEAKNIAFIYLNNRQIFVERNGAFEETIALFPGYNIIELVARDRFNSETMERVRVIFKNPS